MVFSSSNQKVYPGVRLATGAGYPSDFTGSTRPAVISVKKIYDLLLSGPGALAFRGLKSFLIIFPKSSYNISRCPLSEPLDRCSLLVPQYPLLASRFSLPEEVHRTTKENRNFDTRF